MDRAGELPRDLVAPTLSAPPAELPELQTLLTKMSEHAASSGGNRDSSTARDRLLDMEWHQQILELFERLQALAAAATAKGYRPA